MQRHKRGRWTADSASPRVQQQVAALFGRRFDFAPAVEADWRLPAPEGMFPEQEWQVAELQTLKAELNAVKSRLSDKEISSWHEHTCATNRAGLVVATVRRQVRPEMATQAWCKMYELLSSHEVLPTAGGPLRSLHLCEAPGAFVTALNHFCVLSGVPEWDWRASTLNPYHEGNSLSRMIADDRFILHTLQRWHFGDDDTGDLMTSHNAEVMLRDLGKFNLVTADGSFDCQGQPAEQERMVAPLHLCEMFCALRALEVGGTLVLKMFTFFEASSVCLLYLLCACFSRVSVVKPSCSKSGNSEVYLVCRDLVTPLTPGHVERWQRCQDQQLEQRPLFSRQLIPDPFIAQVIECARFFKGLQEAEISRNLSLWHAADSGPWQEVELVRQAAALEFLRRCRLTPIDKQSRLTHPLNPRLYTSFQVESKSGSGTYDQRTLLRSRRQRLAAFAAQLASLPEPPPPPSGGVQWRPAPPGGDFIQPDRRTEGLPPRRLVACKLCSLNQLKLLLTALDAVEPELVSWGAARPQTVVPPGERTVKLTLPGRAEPWICNAETVRALREAAGLLKSGDTLEIRGLFLFHRLNVSLLHFLARLCETVQLLTPPVGERPQPVVRLVSVGDPVALVSLLDSVLSVLTPRTLSLLPAAELYLRPEVETLVRYNDALARATAADLLKRAETDEPEGGDVGCGGTALDPGDVEKESLGCDEKGRVEKAVSDSDVLKGTQGLSSVAVSAVSTDGWAERRY